MRTIAVLGTLDSKGREHAFVADFIRGLGFQTLLIDVGTGDAPQVAPDISREQVAHVGGVPLQELSRFMMPKQMLRCSIRWSAI